MIKNPKYVQSHPGQADWDKLCLSQFDKHSLSQLGLGKVKRDLSLSHGTSHIPTLEAFPCPGTSSIPTMELVLQGRESLIRTSSVTSSGTRYVGHQSNLFVLNRSKFLLDPRASIEVQYVSMSERAQHPLAQVLGADEARAQALAESPMVALSQSRDGRTSYAKVKFKTCPSIQTCPSHSNLPCPPRMYLL